MYPCHLWIRNSARNYRRLPTPRVISGNCPVVSLFSRPLRNTERDPPNDPPGRTTDHAPTASPMQRHPRADTAEMRTMDYMDPATDGLRIPPRLAPATVDEEDGRHAPEPSHGRHADPPTMPERTQIPTSLEPDLPRGSTGKNQSGMIHANGTAQFAPERLSPILCNDPAQARVAPPYLELSPTQQLN